MDFDPGMFSDDEFEDTRDDAAEGTYDEGYEEGYDAKEDELNEELTQEETPDVLDSEYDATALAAAAGFGYHMASDELEERRIAEDILRRRNPPKTGKVQRVSLKNRKASKFKGSPAKRWMYEVATGQKKAKDPVEYTDEEKAAILRYEGEHDHR